MVNQEVTKLMYSEVLGVLMILNPKYINKLPNSLVKYIIDNCDINKIPNIDPNKRIEEQNISKNSRAFLTMLKLKYWCRSEIEKQELIELLKLNEEKYKEKHDYKKIFNNSDKPNNIKSNNIDELKALTNYEKDSIFKRIINWIKNKF